MSLLTTVVKIADGVTNSLGFQTKVTYRRWLGNATGYGDENLGPAKKLRAVVEHKHQSIVTSSGQTVNVRTSILFIDLPALMLATSNQGISVNDSIVLPDGDTGPIYTADGFIDPSVGVGKKVYTQVYLG